MINKKNIINLLVAVTLVFVSCNKALVPGNTESAVNNKESTKVEVSFNDSTIVKEIDLSIINGKWELYSYGVIVSNGSDIEIKEVNEKILPEDELSMLIDNDNETLSRITKKETEIYKININKNVMTLYPNGNTEKAGSFIINSLDKNRMVILREDPDIAENLIPWIFKRVKQ